jgi:hypothetical protein
MWQSEPTLNEILPFAIAGQKCARAERINGRVQSESQPFEPRIHNIEARLRPQKPFCNFLRVSDSSINFVSSIVLPDEPGSLSWLAVLVLVRHETAYALERDFSIQSHRRVKNRAKRRTC